MTRRPPNPASLSTSWLLLLASHCGASTGATVAPPDAAADVPVEASAPSCLPPCLARALAPCGPPAGACVAYITAAPDNWRRCFDHGLVVEAQPMGGHRFRRGALVCAAVQSLGAATLTADTYRDATGTVIAVVARPAGGGSWVVTCDGAEHRVDPTSAACLDDPWVRGRNPHALSCPIGPGSDACRDAR